MSTGYVGGDTHTLWWNTSYLAMYVAILLYGKSANVVR